MSRQDQPVQPSTALPRRFRHDDYTVAIICPAGDELSPILALLDEEHESLSANRDQNAYELGRMGQHNVVIAVMPTVGNNAAAMVVTQLLNDFGRVRFGLLVGVGSGVPKKDYDEDGKDEGYEEEDEDTEDEEEAGDIRLGDVVVSQAQDGFGGVMQFDRGKSTTGGFERTGQLNEAPHVLASNVKRLQSRHDLHGNSIPRLLGEMLSKYARMKVKYRYPGFDRDLLFKASYPHQGGKNCKKCDGAIAVKRKPRSNSHSQVHYGTIGSSNMVIEDTETRDALRDSMNVLCVEMEAADLMEAFPCLVIRGIYDYADSHKNKRWRPYAAATAAAYAKELLLQIPPEAVKQTQTIADALEGLSTKMEKVHENTQKTEKRTMSAEEIDILEWLSPKTVDISTLYTKCWDAHTRGTG